MTAPAPAPTTITAKVTKAQGYDLVTRPERKKGCLNSPDFAQYIGKTLTIRIVEVKETKTTQRPGGVEVTETKKAEVL